jgi:hypothetical protein
MFNAGTAGALGRFAQWRLGSRSYVTRLLLKVQHSPIGPRPVAEHSVIEQISEVPGQSRGTTWSPRPLEIPRTSGATASRTQTRSKRVTAA